jgi:flagellar biosynthesis GTPase FlhF
MGQVPLSSTADSLSRLLTSRAVELEIEGFSEATFKTNLMETLVVPPATRQLLQSLCRKFTSGRTWSADFVEGKGEGSIVLLHGKPGVGKTYTAGKSARKFEFCEFFLS